MCPYSPSPPLGLIVSLMKKNRRFQSEVPAAMVSVWPLRFSVPLEMPQRYEALILASAERLTFLNM